MSAGNQEVVEALRTTLKERDLLRRENQMLRAASSESIAIVGMACRYPGGVGSPAELWDLVAEGRDGISKFPTDRGWDLERIVNPDPEHSGTSYVSEGGFVHDAPDFDADFFSISPREALGTDPQQRLLLESCWEALEDAGIDPASLRGEAAGVFAGVMYQNYGPAAGGTQSLVSGRVAYTLGLEGPAITVDTACSSSLVAMHLAAQALRGGECTLALAGGVTVISTPDAFVEFSRQRNLAPNGRCKSFAEAADGTAFSEGTGMLVLERLSDARRNGHEILALIRGSAVNQDGASNGLTAPNGPSQERVIRQALANARLEAKDIDAVEAHGTGTTLGDPIEAGALLATYGQERENGPLRLGSIKSNIGHTLAAAGVGGTIKMVEAMRHGVLPRSLHIDEPSSKVDWETGEIELLTEPREWEADGRPRRAGVSSFGISGTNAHVILEEAPEQAAATAPDASPGEQPLPGPIPLALSAKSEAGLAQMAERLVHRLQDDPELEPADVAYSLLTTRSSFEHRAVALGSGREELLASLRSLAGGKESEGIVRGLARTEQRPVFLFPGQGSQWEGMALDLLEVSPVFAEKLAECEEALAPHVEWSVGEVLRRSEGAPSIERIEVVQPTLFAVMASLAALWRACGMHPAAVVGHSQGEIVAAHVAGGLSLPDAAMLAALRSRIISKLAGKGGMVSVALGSAELATLLEPWGQRIELAAQNGPSSTILSGDREALDGLLAECERQGIRAREVPAAIPSHSAYVEELREEVLDTLAPLSPRSGEVPFHSTVTGGLLDTAELDASYWYRNLRETVRFEQVTRGLIEQGSRHFVEVSPHPVFALAVGETIEAALQDPSEGSVIGTLRREEAGPRRFALSLAEAQANGFEVDWQAFFAGTDPRRVPLPTYPFQRKRYWLDSTLTATDARSIGLTDAEHPLLGAAIEDPGGERLTLTGRISLATHPWLADHAVEGTVLLPGTAFLELALKAAETLEAQGVAELTLLAPLLLGEGEARLIRVTVTEPDEQGNRPVAIHSRPETEEAQWTEHASGAITDEPSPTPESLTAWPPEGAEPLEVTYLYDVMAEAGFHYGPAFQGLSAAWKRGEEVFVEVALPEEQARLAERFAIHPALLDAALHGIALTGGDAMQPMLPFSWSGVSLHAQGAGELRARIVPRGEGESSLEIADAQGAPLAHVQSLTLRPMDPSLLRGAGQKDQGLLALRWSEVSLPEGEHEGSEEEAELLRPEIAGEGPEAAREGAAWALVEIQRHLAAGTDSRLAFLTRGAVATAEGESPDPAAAALWGLVRSAQSEHPGRFALIDTDGGEASQEALPAALALTATEPQLALREGEALAGRALALSGTEDRLVAPRGPWRLEAAERGSLEGLALVPDPALTAPLGPTQVRVQMRAAGLNFREVLMVLGYNVPAGEMLGGEGAGVVVEVGSQVEDLQPGEAVFGPIPLAFSQLAVVERSYLRALPEEWSFEQGASVPVVFSTAYLGLCEKAGLKAGEKVLIHAGAGGVGMAAIQIAQHIGAEVFATASPAKWDVLHGLGLAEDHIASSRDLEFKDKFLRSTGGEGVDVVLNSLAGEFVDASLELLPRGGRFLEMGRTDMRDPEQVADAHPGVAYEAYDVIFTEEGRKEAILAEILALFESGALRHLPIATYDMREAPAAFRHLREGRNVGKLVLTVPRVLDPERTVLITGATGGLGSLVARHLAERHGARHLLLLSRSGPEAEGAEELERELRELGAKAEIAACDVSDRKALAETIAQIPKEHPLGAVFHAAGALADGTIESLDQEGLEHVFAPKANAAWHLHELSEGAELSAFVLFSSIAGALGGPGQGNYAAANVFLDALAEKRSAEGLPATSIAWGLWERESAMTSHLEEQDLARIRRSGIGSISDEQGLAFLDAALAAAPPTAIALPLERSALRSLAQAGALPPVMSGLVRTPIRRGPSGSLAARLATLPEAEREAHVLELVRTEVAAVLGHGSAKEVEPARAFKDLGFDSLAAVELRNRLGATTGLRLTATVVFDHPNAAALAAHLLAEASAEGPATRVAVRATASEEPIAIVGMACRYPGGVGSPSELWQLVAEGRDAITGFPTDRGWDLERLYDPDPEHPGTSYTRHGGFLADVAGFDAGFFGISPREALIIDPQERLLLESSWEALEDAGVDPLSLGKSHTGVFAGVAFQDYGPVPIVSSSSVSGRVAYTLGLEGPAITVNTACSSSLVAAHLASRALQQGECALALAGGVTVLAGPGAFIEFSRQRGLSRDGRCRSFAETADGTGFSEGVGMLVLERLSDAERNGHEVLALLKGSAVNQDGASNGFLAPNGPSQERVIRQALANARLEPKDIDVVEAHGTGTTLGDPIEAGALLATYGQEREEPLRLGSIKSNIGHTQAAAGVAGVIKMVQAMREEVLPRTLHADELSTKVDWEGGRIELLTEEARWTANGAPRRAGVSAFGASGTNAHVVLEEAPSSGGAGSDAAREDGDAEAVAAAQLPGQIPFALSAKTEPALAVAAERLAGHLRANPELPLQDVAYSLATTRPALEQRAVALGADRAQLLSSLDALAENRDAPMTARGAARHQQQPIFLFAGQGSQAKEMAVGLIDSSPAFADRIAACEEALSEHVEWSLTEILRDPEGAWLDRTDIIQPALFAVMVSLAGRWEECGVRPAAVVGHSQGEVAAACVAGALSLSDACLVVVERAKAMSTISGKGRMLLVSLGAEQLPQYTSDLGDRFSLAAINGPNSLVLSGDNEALGQIESACKRDGVAVRRLAVDQAAHSAQMDPLREGFLEALAPISPRDAQAPLYSTVYGREVDTREMGPEYWYRNLRQTVQLETVVRSLVAAGRRSFIEVGPHPVLAVGITETIEDELGSTEESTLLPTLRHGEDDGERFALSLAEAHAQGIAVDWDVYFDEAGASRVRLPTYAFQRQRYWLDPDLSGLALYDMEREATGHPFLRESVEVGGVGGNGLLSSGSLSLQAQPWLARRAVAGEALVPGGVFLEMALQACASTGAGFVEELVLGEPVFLAEESTLDLQMTVEAPDEEGRRRLAIHSRDSDADRWIWRARGIISPASASAPAPLSAWPPAGGGVCAEVLLAEGDSHEAQRFILHPELLELAIDGAGLGENGSGEIELPREWRGVALHRMGADGLRLVVAREGDARGLRAYDLDGAPVFSAASLELGQVDRGESESARRRRRLFVVDWLSVPLAATDHAGAETVEILPAGFEDGGLAAAAQATAEQALGHVQQWIADEERGGERLALITRNAVAAREDEQPDLVTASIWGLMRSAISEHPGRFALIDTDGSAASEGALTAALALGATEPELALREGQALVPRMTAVSSSAIEESSIPPLDPTSTVLIAGDVEGRGKAVADHLASAHGVEHFRYAGATDLADPVALGRVIDSAAAEHPLRAVVYVPVEDDALQAQIEAAWRLHESTAELEMSRLLVFSSVDGLLGGVGRASVAACSTFLDALARHRRGLGLLAGSISWGGWGAEGDDLALRLSDEEALALFDAARELDLPLLAVLRLSPARLRDTAERGVLPATLHDLTSVRPIGVRSRQRPEDRAGRLAALGVEEREAEIVALLRAQAAEMLGYGTAAEVDSTRSLLELGIDSQGGMELRNRIAAKIGVEVPVATLAAQPSVRELAQRIGQALDPSTSADREGERPSTAFAGLLGQAQEQGETGAFMDLLTGAARYRSRFDHPLEGEDAPAAVSLADGEASPGVILISSLVAMSGPQEFARMARGLRGKRSAIGLPLPGFAAGGPLPADLDVFAESMAEAIRRDRGDSSFALVGYSSGGWAAHEVAASLERSGASPAAVVLLDTPSTRLDTTRLLDLAPMVGGDREEQLFAPPDDAQLTAMARYFELFGAWEPKELSAPVLMVRAAETSEPLYGQIDEMVETLRPLATVEAPGDHYTMMGDYAEETARTLDELLASLAQEPLADLSGRNR